MTSIGHPLLADLTYGGSVSEFIQRQALHACRLTFVHPMTGQQMMFSSVLPNDMKAALAHWSLSYNQGEIIKSQNNVLAKDYQFGQPD